MMESAGKQWIEQLRKRWAYFSLGKVFLISLAIAIPVAALMSRLLQQGLLGFLFPFGLTFIALSLRNGYWKISAEAICRFIDLRFPAAEESSALLLKPAETLSFLEQWQARKVNEVLIQQKQPAEPIRQLKWPLVFLLLAVVLSLGIIRFPLSAGLSGSQATAQARRVPQVKENIPAQVSAVELRITPPAYTGKSSFTQQQFTIRAESGAQVNWQVHTSQSLNKLELIFNDSEHVLLNRANQEGTSWSLSRTLSKPGFYQLLIAGQRSDFYQIAVIPDLPVAIRISKPAQHSTIDIGQPQAFSLGVLLTDDYGIAGAYISATMASGKGEAVSFKEKKIAFNRSFNAQKQVQLSQLISLKDLGMKPGDELYFYVNASDNHGQQSRSDMYTVSIQDTTELMSMTGIDNGVNLVPEYFRSERQLIIDTEKLLKEKASLSEVEFKNRSNNLGIDQKMLRLRYGKFLGEESEASIGGHAEATGEFADHDHDHQEAGEGKFGDMQGVMDQYAHKHDNAEDATFFEPGLKSQLKATLTEMWNAELRLRTYVPEQALPYEYKALRLLKDLQQKSRAYVAKTTIKTSPLKPEKRLTGELKDIQDARTNSKFESKGDPKPVLEIALALLESLKEGQPRTPRDIGILLQAQRELIAQASASPAAYLPALKAIKKIIASGQSAAVNGTDIARTENGLNRLMGRQDVRPYSGTRVSSSALTRAYFNQLKRSAP